MKMETRTELYASNDVSTRSSRNRRLYKEVYGKYDDLNNLPLEDNTDEIDMEKLKEIIRKNTEKKEVIDTHSNVIENRKRNIDEQRVYDINKILEKAKYENNKLKESDLSSKIDTSILSTLQNREISLEEIEETSRLRNKKDDLEEKLSMTRELKFKGLVDENKPNMLMENVMPNNDLSLDLFENLRPTENTITTKPMNKNILENTIPTSKNILEKTTNVKEINNTHKLDVHSGDTTDIDIIKKGKTSENDFFTSSYEFSKKDFLIDEPEKQTGIFKIILLLLLIIIISGVIAYFVLNFGIGI